MSIEEIEKRILAEAAAEEEKIRVEAEKTIQQLECVHKDRMEKLKLDLAESARKKAEAVKRAILVPARQKAKRELLEAKKKILDQIYLEIKEQKKLPDIEINKIREDTEVRAAQILFGT